MIIEQTIESPAKTENTVHHRLTERQRASIEKCRGIAKRMGSRLSSDDFLEMRRTDREVEGAKYQQMLGKEVTIL